MSSKITGAVDFSVNTDSEYEQLHLSISPGSNSDLHSFGPAQGRPATGKIAVSPQRAYLRYRQFPKNRYSKNGCFVYHLPLEHGRESIRHLP